MSLATQPSTFAPSDSFTTEAPVAETAETVRDRNYSAFLKQYNEFYEKILNYVFYRTGQDKSLAEDLTQEIFLKALEKYHLYDQTRSFQSWLYTIARNHLTDFYRKRREKVSYDKLENTLFTTTDFAGNIDRMEQVKEILANLSRLTADEQELVTLKFVQELTTEEIADVLGKKPNAIYVGLHRAIKKLRSYMDAPEIIPYTGALA